MKNTLLYIVVVVSFLITSCADKDSRVTGVTILPREVELEVGQSIELTAIVTPENATEKTVYWFTDDFRSVTVDDNGRITRVTNEWFWYGYVTIYAITKEGGYVATCRVYLSE